MRINKFLSSAGLGSRRKVEALVNEGRVKVNGEVVDSLVFSVFPKDVVFVDGNEVALPAENVYVMLHKPKGYITAVSDDRGRKTVMDLLPENLKHLKPVGRLDYDSEGLLILTDDGELTYALTHPSHEVGKTYLVKVEGEIKESQLAVLRAGVVVEGKRLAKCKVKLQNYDGHISKLEITIFEGKNRQIRKMFEAVGFKVVFLKRTQIGELRLSGVDRGKYRLLSAIEIEYLKSL
ncbi:MAG: rRNA pseudouridine synthase [Clostridia bacterium]|nr:rRNA pseudouridine synthase [Clostridia bacterium]